MKKILLFLCFTLDLLAGGDSPITESTVKEEEESGLQEIVLTIPKIDISRYLRSSNGLFSEALNGYFTENIQEIARSPEPEKKKLVSLLERLSTEPEQDDDTRTWKELQQMILNSTQSVFADQNNKITEMQKQMDKRWSKKKSVVVTTATSVVSGVIIAVITYFTSKY